MRRLQRIGRMVPGVLLLVLLGAGSALALDAVVTVGAMGMAGPDLTAAAGYGEYEQAVTDKLTVVARAGYLSYAYDDDVYQEDGQGPGVNAGVRFYPRRALHGFYVGAHLGLWQTEWDWKDDVGQTYESRGDGDSTAAEVDAVVGFRFGERVQINPSLQIGQFLNDDSELGFYGIVGVAVGFGL